MGKDPIRRPVALPGEGKRAVRAGVAPDVHTTTDEDARLRFIRQQDDFCRLLPKRDQCLIGCRGKPVVERGDIGKTDDDDLRVRVFTGKDGQLFATKDKLAAPRSQCSGDFTLIFRPLFSVLHRDVADDVCGAHLRKLQEESGRWARF